MDTPAWARKPLLMSILLGAAAWPLALSGQSSFEVLSVKPFVAGSSGDDSSVVDILPGGSLRCRNVSVRKWLRLAFGMEDQRITGAPSWIDSVSYDIVAKTAGEPVTPENISPLLLAALEERLKLKYSRRKQERPAYALEVLPAGVKLRVSAPGTEPSMVQNTGDGNVSIFHATSVSLSDFARVVARQMGRPVTDKTGIPHRFDVDLKWSKDPATEGLIPSLTTVLRDVGLRLTPIRTGVETIAVDHIERASEN